MTATAKFVGNADHGLIDSLVRTIDQVLDPLIPREGELALVDFPHTPNVGDSLIWLGTLAWLERNRRAAPRYVCSDLTYEARTLARRIGNGTILIGGGGNFGDLYPAHQELRERVIADFPDHRIVQLPQSIHFEADAELARACRVLNRHARLTLLVRDRPSLELARSTFSAPSALCPDLAFSLGALHRPAPTKHIVWLSRADKEARSESAFSAPGVDRVDWMEDDPQALTLLHLRVNRWLRHRPAIRPWIAPWLGATFRRVADLRLERGIRILSAGELVVTNRLHGYVLALLLGIPHYVVDNSYGKVRALHEAWTRGSKLTRFCDTQAEALERGLRERGEAGALTALRVDSLRSSF